MTAKTTALTALLLAGAFSQCGCLRYQLWRQDMKNAAARRAYSNSVADAAEEERLLGTWSYKAYRPDHRISLSLFSDGRFSLRWVYSIGKLPLFSHCHLLEGTWEKIGPGKVRLTFDEEAQEGPRPWFQHFVPGPEDNIGESDTGSKQSDLDTPPQLTNFGFPADPDSDPRTEEVDLTKATNVFVEHDRMLKE